MKFKEFDETVFSIGTRVKVDGCWMCIFQVDFLHRKIETEYHEWVDLDKIQAIE